MLATKGAPFCLIHTCETPGCKASKSSRSKFCEKHMQVAGRHTPTSPDGGCRKCCLDLESHGGGGGRGGGVSRVGRKPSTYAGFGEDHEA